MPVFKRGPGRPMLVIDKHEKQRLERRLNRFGQRIGMVRGPQAISLAASHLVYQMKRNAPVSSGKLRDAITYVDKSYQKAYGISVVGIATGNDSIRDVGPKFWFAVTIGLLF